LYLKEGRVVFLIRGHPIEMGDVVVAGEVKGEVEDGKLAVRLDIFILSLER
jgi:hypothetical protein